MINDSPILEFFEGSSGPQLILICGSFNQIQEFSDFLKDITTKGLKRVSLKERYPNFKMIKVTDLILETVDETDGGECYIARSANQVFKWRNTLEGWNQTTKCVQKMVLSGGEDHCFLVDDYFNQEILFEIMLKS